MILIFKRLIAREFFINVEQYKVMTKNGSWRYHEEDYIYCIVNIINCMYK